MYGYFCIGFIDFMHGDKSLTDYTNLFLSYNLKKNIFLKMIEVPNIYLNLSNKTQFRLNKMNKI